MSEVIPSFRSLELDHRCLLYSWSYVLGSFCFRGELGFLNCEGWVDTIAAVWVLYVWFFVWMAGPGICILSLVLGGYLRILGAPSVQSCCAPYRYLFSTVYFSVADMANPVLFVCGCRTWICFDMVRFYEEQCQPSSRSAWPAWSKMVNRTGGGKYRHNLHSILPKPLRLLHRLYAM